MKPKLSSGYLTPQASRIRRVPTPTHSESNNNINALNNVNDSFFEKLLSCPVKRQLILNLISSEKENIKEYKRKESEEQKRAQLNGSPLSKVQKKYQCESPTALLRRRALERQARESPVSETSSISSRQSVSSSSASPIPFDKLLNGVIAYVEIRSKDKDQDRSSGAKALMQSMGALVKDQFTKDVTHVVFKDGSFATYQKAKLMKVHMVSVLWVEAVRSSNMRVPERKFPALGTEAYDHNVSSLCSQMQKDYEEIIREEVRRSLAAGTPLPSTKSLINRRRSIMTPVPSSSQRSQEFSSTQDKEVEQITFGRTASSYGSSTPVAIKLSPELTSDDDSDLGTCINGSIVNRKKYNNRTINSIENFLDSSNMDLTSIRNAESSLNLRITEDNMKTCESSMDMTTLNGKLVVEESIADSGEKVDSDNSIYNKRTPKIKSRKYSERSHDQKVSDNGFSIPDDSLYRRRTRQVKVNISSLPDELIERKKDEGGIYSRDVLLQLLPKPSSLQIISKNVCSPISNSLAVQGDNGSTSLSSLRLSSEKHSIIGKSTSTNMSSLRVSSNFNKDKCDAGLHNERHIAEKSTSTNMSSLHISSQSNEDIKRSIKISKISDKSTSTNMSALFISADSSKDQVNIDKQKNTDKQVNENSNENASTKKRSLSKPQEKSFNSMGDNSFSPLNPKTIKEVLQILDDTTKPDENVTRRRRGGPRKSIAPIDIIQPKIGESSPPKQCKKAVMCETAEIETKIDKGRRKTLRGKIETCPKDSLNIASRTLGVRRKTMLPVHPVTKEQTSIKNVTPKPLKDNENLKNSKEVQSDSELSNNKRTLRERRKTIHGRVKTPPENKSESDTSGSDKKRRMRKLYNPDESLKDIIVSDEQEREHKRIEIKKRKSNEGIILNPEMVSAASNILLTTKAKEFIEKNKINIQTLLNRESEVSEEDKTSRRRGRKKQNKNKRVSVNSDADEQQKLAEEFVNKKEDTNTGPRPRKPVAKSEGKIIKRRQSVRLSQHPRKVLNFDSSISSSDEKKCAPRIPGNRRSTMEFQTMSQTSVKRKLKIDKSKQPTIVCTRLHKDGIQMFNQIVKRLGGFVIEDEVSDKTTHLVAGEPKRTINMLRAIARGCWILKHEWLLKSLEEGKWLSEEDYEETDFSPAVQKCRIQRQAFGPSFSMDIFQGCGPIYVARGSIPRCSDLRELVSLCKGQVVTIPRNAAIIIGENARHEGVTSVKETWLLDSITFNRKMPFKKYLIATGGDSPHV